MLALLLSCMLAESPLLSRVTQKMAKGETYTILGDKAIVIIHNAMNWKATYEIDGMEPESITAGESNIIDFGAYSGKIVLTATENLLLQYSLIIPGDSALNKAIKIVTKIDESEIELTDNLIIASPYPVRVTSQSGSLNAFILKDDGEMTNYAVDRIVNNFYIAYFSTKNAAIKCKPIVRDPFSFRCDDMSYVRSVVTLTGEMLEIVDKDIVVDFEKVKMIDFYIQTYNFTEVTIKAGKDHYTYFQDMDGIYPDEPHGHVMFGGDLKVRFIQKNFITYVSLLDNSAKFVNVITGNYEAVIDSGVFWLPTLSVHEIELDVFGATIYTLTRTITTGNGELSWSGRGSLVLEIPVPAVLKHTSSDSKFTSFAAGKSAYDDSYGLLLRKAPIEVKDVCGFALKKNSAYIFDLKGNFTLGMSSFAGAAIVIKGVEFEPIQTMVQLNGVSSILIKVFESELSVAFAPSNWGCQDFITISGKHVEMELNSTNQALANIVDAKKVCLFALTDSNGYHSVETLGKITKHDVGCGFVCLIPSLDKSFSAIVHLGAQRSDQSGASATSIRVYSYQKQQLTDTVINDRPTTRHYFAPQQTQIVDSIAPNELAAIKVAAGTTVLVQNADGLSMFLASGGVSKLAPNGARTFRFSFDGELHARNTKNETFLLRIDALKHSGDIWTTSCLEDRITIGGSDFLKSAWIVPPGESQMEIMNTDPLKEVSVNGAKFNHFLQKTFAFGPHRMVTAEHGAVVSWKTPVSFVDTEPINTTVENCQDHICIDNAIQSEFHKPGNDTKLIIFISIAVIIFIIILIIAIVFIVKYCKKKKLTEGISADLKVSLV